MQNEINKVKKAYANATPEDQDYAKKLLTWLSEWLSKSGKPHTESDPGDHPLPPPPHP